MKNLQLLEQGCPNFFLEESKMIVKNLKEPNFELVSNA